MRTLGKALLTAEVVICFAPLAFALLWMCAVTATPFLMMLHGGGYDGWDEWTRGLLPFTVAAMGCSAVFVTLRFIFSGVRLLSVSALGICSLAGLTGSTVEIIDQQTWDAEVIAFLLAPLLCGPRLLYLGRSYFIGANKTRL
jgi:hypothetical protein